MVYDNTLGNVRYDGEMGYAIHECPEEPSTGTPKMYELYTDDGRGNGDYICSARELFWIRVIADRLDRDYLAEYDYTGNRK